MLFQITHLLHLIFVDHHEFENSRSSDCGHRLLDVSNTEQLNIDFFRRIFGDGRFLYTCFVNPETQRLQSLLNRSLCNAFCNIWLDTEHQMLFPFFVYVSPCCTLADCCQWSIAYSQKNVCSTVEGSRPSLPSEGKINITASPRRRTLSEMTMFPTSANSIIESTSR